MQLVDRIEKRRFVGRELLLYVWMESELFDATLETAEHGSFGLWLEKKLVLSSGAESTRITAPMPGRGREAKEALLRGQLPEAAGLCIAWRDDETRLAIDGESFAIGGLKLRTLLDQGSGGGFSGDLVDEMMGKRPGKPKRKAADDDDDDDTPFYERMTMTREVEDLLAALYRDFLAVRLGRRWGEVVVPTMRRWAEGHEVDVEAYRRARAAKPGAREPKGAIESPAKPSREAAPEPSKKAPERAAAKPASRSPRRRA